MYETIDHIHFQSHASIKFLTPIHGANQFLKTHGHFLLMDVPHFLILICKAGGKYAFPFFDVIKPLSFEKGK